MAGLRLTSGGESRLDGAPYQDLPDYAFYVDAVAAKLLQEDADGLLANDRELAREHAKEIVNAELNKQRQASAAAQARVAEDYGRRQKGRAQASGVDPEDMPYGASASDVRLANRPVAEASAQLKMEQDAADRIVRGLREGTPTFDAQGDLDFLRERGDMNPLAGPGQTDMAMRAAIRERRGQYYEMPDGTRIPVGREPTAAELRAERDNQSWINETPGSERQAKYNPAGYEQFREGVRQQIRDDARADMAKYGTGPDDNDRRAKIGLPPLTSDQQSARAARKEAEIRQRHGQRGRFYEQRLQVETGMPAGTDIGEMEAERFRQRQLSNKRDLAVRQDNLRNQRLLLAPGGKGVANAINELPEGWRQIAILDRITNGRRGGATPLDVEAQKMANALPVFRSMVAGAMQDMDPNAPEARRMQRELELRRTAGVAKAAGWNKPAAVLEALERQGATPAEINMIMADLFGPGWKPQQEANAEAVRDAAAGVLEAPPPGI